MSGPGKLRHHPTGRDERGRYLDPLLTIPVSHDQHENTHDDWRSLDLENAKGPLPGIERVELRLRRFAATCARLDDGRHFSLFGMLSMAFSTWAVELAKSTQHLDERYPSWRDDPDFYP